MPSQYPYRTTIRNEYLGVSKVVRAMTATELEWLMEAQLAKWDEQESRKRQQQIKEAERSAAKRALEDLKAWAERETIATSQKIESFRTILTGSLHLNLAINWEQLLDTRPFRPFQFHHPKPNKDQIRVSLLGPEPVEPIVPQPLTEKPSFFELFLPFLRRK
jgi:restriction system protein